MKISRITFSEILLEDAHLIHQGLSNSELTKYYGVHFNTLEETQTQMDWYEDLNKSEKGVWFKIQLIHTHEFIGAVGFNDWDHKKMVADIGCWILPEFWGKGFGTESMKKAIDYGFEELLLKEVVGFIDSKNTGIKKVLKKLNFEHFKSSEEIDSKNGNKINLDHFQLFNTSFNRGRT